MTNEFYLEAPKFSLHKIVGNFASVSYLHVLLENVLDISDTLRMDELSLNTTIQQIAIGSIPVLFAITLHEVAHGRVASWLGDQTARVLGRLSLNPIKHIDPIGTILVPIFLYVTTSFMIGWAKPVPINPRFFKHPRRDNLLVSLAGPLANLLMAIIWAWIFKVGGLFEQAGNIWFGEPLKLMAGIGVYINLILAALNLLPFPPLDGGAILLSVLPARLAYRLNMIPPFYAFLFLMLLVVTNILPFLLVPVIKVLNFIVVMLSGLNIFAMRLL